MTKTDFIQLSEQIVDNFEHNAPIPTCSGDWSKDSDFIMLYLAAKKVIENH